MVAVPQHLVDVRHIEANGVHALVLLPMHLLMPDERRFVDALGQDEHAQRRQRDACEAGGAQEPANDVRRGAGGHDGTTDAEPSATYQGSTAAEPFAIIIR